MLFVMIIDPEQSGEKTANPGFLQDLSRCMVDVFSGLPKPIN
jgi:hypothetical protein